MPAMVGGFGNTSSILSLNNIFNYSNYSSSNISYCLASSKNDSISVNFNSNLGSYLAGLIEGDGTFSIHDSNSIAKNQAPKIIIVFKKADLPLAKYLQELTTCGTVQIKADRGYVL